MAGKKNRLERTLRKLAKKRIAVLEWLGDFEGAKSDEEILKVAYRRLGKKIEVKAETAGSLHGHYSYVIGLAGIQQKKPAKVASPRKPRDSISAFYKTAEWKRARYDALAASNGCCELCGANKKDGVRLNVDHIRPLRKYWELRLDPSNLQVLCGSCNQGKGNRDETDWRRDEDHDNVIHPAAWYRNYA